MFALLMTVGLLNLSIVEAQVTFTDVTASASLGNISNYAGGTWGDYDNDNDVDLFLFRDGAGKQLYRNEGDGRFVDVTQDVGLKDIPDGASSAIFVDFDNDGDLDLFMGGEGSSNGDVLYRNNGNGTFTNISKTTGMNTEVRQYFGAISFDFDADGLLDIYIANWTSGNFPNFLYHNEGNGRFEEIAAQVGLDKPKFNDGVTLGNYDNDGDLDILMTTASTSSPQNIDVLYRNEGNGKFTDVTQQAGLRREAFDKDAFFWDYNNDGHLDLFIHSWPSYAAGKTSVLYRNNGDGTFADVTKSAGIVSLEIDSSGAYYGDYDNDGWLDLCITYKYSPTLLYHNNGDGTFTDVSKEAGISGKNTGTVSFADYDIDGDLDIFTGTSETGNVMLYRNNGTPNHWLELKLAGVKSNRDAIGARFKVIAGKLSMIHEVAGCSGGYYGNKQDRLPVHFGLGENQKADLIEIRWPSGLIEKLENVPANQLIQVQEGSSGLYGVTAVQPDGKLPITWGKVKSDRLYQNYPNPFNPDTWIPYQLAEDVDVTIRIYNASGQLIRTLSLGNKPAGFYTSEDKATYWDGKNETGEKVSGGIYFYSIHAGDFTSTKKMIIVK
jgi:hypothetical protein